MMRGDATTGKGSWRRVREFIYTSYFFQVYMYILLSVYIYTATWKCYRYTPTCLSRRCPGKMTEGGGLKERESN